MPTPDPQTLAPRSGLVPQCAKGGKPLALLVILFSACLNPMPEEFPSNDDGVPVIGEPGSSSDANDEANGAPIVPEQNSGPGDIFGGGAGSGGSGGNVSSPLPQSPSGNDGEVDPAAPDAGADAGAPSAEATGTDEGETTP
jgi:hypothetical protein